METASGPGPILVVDGDARPVGWADVAQAEVRVFQLGATFSPRNRASLRGALDSALTSPFGLAVAVTADTGRICHGVVSADAILDKVRDVRTSACWVDLDSGCRSCLQYEPAAESGRGDMTTMGEPDYAAEAAGESEQAAPATDSSSLNKPSRCSPDPAEACSATLGRGGARRGRRTREVEEAKRSKRPKRSASRTHKLPLLRLLRPSPGPARRATPSGMNTVGDGTINIEQAESERRRVSGQISRLAKAIQPTMGIGRARKPTARGSVSPGVGRRTVNLDWRRGFQRNLAMIGDLLVDHIILSVLPVLITPWSSRCRWLSSCLRKTKRVTPAYILAFLGVIYSNSSRWPSFCDECRLKSSAF